MNTDRIKELEAMIRFGDELLKEYEQNNEEAPEFVYKKMILLHNELIELIKAETEKIKAGTKIVEAMNKISDANKVFENKRS